MTKPSWFSSFGKRVCRAGREAGYAAKPRAGHRMWLPVFASTSRNQMLSQKRIEASRSLWTVCGLAWTQQSRPVVSHSGWRERGEKSTSMNVDLDLRVASTGFSHDRKPRRRLLARIRRNWWEERLRCGKGFVFQTFSRPDRRGHDHVHSKVSKQSRKQTGF